MFGLYAQNTVYVGEYHARHPNIVTFWEAFEELTDDQKKSFLRKYGTKLLSVEENWRNHTVFHNAGSRFCLHI